MKTALCRAIVAVVTTALSVATSHAQTSSREGGGLFGDTEHRPSSQQRLNFLVDVGEAYDQNVTVHAGDTAFSPFQASGFYSLFTPSLDFASHAGEHVQLALTASSNVRYYNQFHETFVTNHAVGAGATVQLASKTSVSFNQGLTYAPALLYGLFNLTAAPVIGEAIPPASNYTLDNEKSYASASSARLNQQLTPRLSLSLEGNAGFTDFTGSNPRYQDIWTRDAGGHFSYSLDRNTGVRFGYTYRQSEYGLSPRSTEQNFVIGLDHSRILSRTRRTIFAVAMGSTLATAPTVIAASSLRQQYRLIGDASVAHQIGRTWTLRGSYHRGMGYIQGFDAPVFTGASSLAASGFLGRRTDVSFSAAYSTGEAALTGTPSQFTTYTGDARVRYAVSRNWATYVEYLFYYYEFNQNLALPVGLPPGLTRNGLRTGMTMWIPMRRK